AGASTDLGQQVDEHHPRFTFATRNPGWEKRLSFPAKSRSVEAFHGLPLDRGCEAMTRNAAASGLVRRNPPAPDEQIRGWTVRDSLELYQVNSWGDGYFSINDRGRVQVTPQGPQGPGVDLLDLVQELERRGLRAPLLIRFTDILASRIERI